MRMRRPVSWLCLIAALICPGVCLAEAAEELAQSLAELQQSNVLESGESPAHGGDYLPGGGRIEPGPWIQPDSGAGLWHLLDLPQALTAGLFAPVRAHFLHDLPPYWPPHAARLRLAWLRLLRC